MGSEMCIRDRPNGAACKRVVDLMDVDAWECLSSFFVQAVAS